MFALFAHEPPPVATFESLESSMVQVRRYEAPQRTRLVLLPRSRPIRAGRNARALGHYALPLGNMGRARGFVPRGHPRRRLRRSRGLYPLTSRISLGGSSRPVGRIIRRECGGIVA